MLNNLSKYTFILFLFVMLSSCSDDPVNLNNNNNTPGDIFYVRSLSNFTFFATYSIKADGSDSKVFKDSMLVTSIPYSEKVTLGRLDIGLFYNRMYVVNTDGSNMVSIPRNNYYPIYLALSPRADKVLFTSDAGNYLVVADVNGTNLLQISDGIRGTEYIPKFSPDGNYIAYFEAPPSLTTGFYIIRSDGTGKTLIKDNILYDIGATLDWSPDGNRIVFQSSENFPPEICVINVDGTGFRALTDGENPAWSPDGSKIAFLKNINNGVRDIFIINPDGSDEINLTNTPNEHDGPPCWSPDSKKILYHIQVSYPGSLRLFDLSSMNSTVLKDSASSMGFWKR